MATWKEAYQATQKSKTIAKNSGNSAKGLNSTASSVNGYNYNGTLATAIQDIYGSSAGAYKYSQNYAKELGKANADYLKESQLAAEQYQYDLNQIGAQYGADLAIQQQQQAYELYSDSTQLQRQMADAKAAGVNTAVIGGNQNTGLTSGAVSALPQTGQQANQGDSNTGLVFAAMANLASKHPKDFFNKIYQAAKQQASNAITQMKGAAKK